MESQPTNNIERLKSGVSFCKLYEYQTLVIIGKVQAEEI
jgi:hypothetical protein